ncbi:MAG: type II secretion system minor pseudopilin GspK [Gammaproteobacteria bacterium]|nr:type II secretion system minor pseudopilin GspK [Gammaproteobacteria bacterium]MDH5309804.1 type II secretion system minor pseudopilin GspK [Gammaproteobacteria bacterium]
MITAMLIAALAAIVAANLAWDNALDVRRTTMMLNRDQAMQVALGAESWVASILRDDLADSTTDHLGELWATQLPGLPIEGGEVFGVVEDLQGRFNVNNLVDDSGQIDEPSLEQFRRLVATLGLDPRIAGIMADWIDADLDASFPDGAEDSIYTGFFPPYRTANLPLSSASELAALEGMDKASFDLLSPHIVALPGRTAINVNTATAAVLQSLSENMSAAEVEGLVAERQSAGFASVEDAFTTLVEPEVLNTLAETTSYFQLRVVVRIDTVRITLYSVLQRGAQGNVTPILRSFGTG